MLMGKTFVCYTSFQLTSTDRMFLKSQTFDPPNPLRKPIDFIVNNFVFLFSSHNYFLSLLLQCTRFDFGFTFYLIDFC